MAAELDHETLDVFIEFVLEQFRTEKRSLDEARSELAEAFALVANGSDPSGFMRARIRRDPLYVRIKEGITTGDPPISVRDATERFGYSEGHTRRVLHWMANLENPPSMTEEASDPRRWRRI